MAKDSSLVDGGYAKTLVSEQIPSRWDVFGVLGQIRLLNLHIIEFWGGALDKLHHYARELTCHVTVFKSDE